MPVVVIDPPQPALSLAEAKRHLRVEGDDDDADIDAMIAAAQGQIDGPAGSLGRAIGKQTLELQGWDQLDGCSGTIVLPYPPTVAVVSVTDGAGVVVPAASYVVGPGNVIRPVQSWPWSFGQQAGPRIRYTAGYPDSDGAQTIPAPIKAALKLMVADLYSDRGGKIAAGRVDNPTIARLLAPYRIFSH